VCVRHVQLGNMTVRKRPKMSSSKGLLDCMHDTKPRNTCALTAGKNTHQSSRSVAPMSGHISSIDWRRTPAANARWHAWYACSTCSFADLGNGSGGVEAAASFPVAHTLTTCRLDGRWGKPALKGLKAEVWADMLWGKAHGAGMESVC
jgi:hypothetical protein